MSYLDRHRACGLKVGDLVRVTRIAKGYENGWSNCWVSGKNHCVGQVYEIQEDNQEYGFRLKDSDPDFKLGWHFPYFILEKVAPEPPKPKGFWNLKVVKG